MVEQPGTIRVVRGRRDAPAAVPRHPRPGPATAASRGCSRSPSTPSYAKNRRFFVYYVNRDGDIEVDGFKRKRDDADAGRPGLAAQGDRIAHPQFANHNGGQLQFGPDGMLYLGTGDGGGAGDPHGNAQNRNVPARQAAADRPERKGDGYSHARTPTRSRAARARRDLRARAAQPVPLLLRPPLGRHLHRRRRPGRLGGDRPRLAQAAPGRELRLGHASRATTTSRAGEPPAHYRRRCSSTRRRGSATARSPAATSSATPSLPALAGRYVYADFCDGDDALVRPRRPGPTRLAPTGLHVAEPTSFGEGADGRIYVTSLAGGCRGSSSG